MKVGHPRVYNPFQSPEYVELMGQDADLTDAMNVYAACLFDIRTQQVIVWAQSRDCILTREEQVARLRALDEVGAPQ